jgi:hypothetical protein
MNISLGGECCQKVENDLRIVSQKGGKKFEGKGGHLPKKGRKEFIKVKRQKRKGS